MGMRCNACAKFLLCDRKECNFKRIRDVEVRRINYESTNDTRNKREKIHPGKSI